MSITIKPLSPELAGTFSDYLTSLDYGHAPHWATCFCRFYHSDCSVEEWQDRSGVMNKTEAQNEIEAGRMKGYLAFDGDTCIGWCNANHSTSYTRLAGFLGHLTSNQKIGCIICYVVHPDYRNKGIARLLLHHAVMDFTDQGYDAIMALPVNNHGEPEKLYRGTMNMYLERGFEVVEEHDDVSVMWMQLSEQ